MWVPQKGSWAGETQQRVSASFIIIFPPPAITVLKQGSHFTWQSISGTQVLHNVCPSLSPFTVTTKQRHRSQCLAVTTIITAVGSPWVAGYLRDSPAKAVGAGHIPHVRLCGGSV